MPSHRPLLRHSAGRSPPLCTRATATNRRRPSRLSRAAKPVERGKRRLVRAENVAQCLPHLFFCRKGKLVVLRPEPFRIGERPAAAEHPRRKHLFVCPVELEN